MTTDLHSSQTCSEKNLENSQVRFGTLTEHQARFETLMSFKRNLYTAVEHHQRGHTATLFRLKYTFQSTCENTMLSTCLRFGSLGSW